jgi:hypothetical protein
VKPTSELPDDPELPGLAAIRVGGLAGALPALGLTRCPVGYQLYGYTEGSRATLEVRAGARRFAVKAYEALAAAGLAGDSGARVPPLLAWNRDLKLMAIGWLEGQPANDLVKEGRGARAGEVGACWLRRMASLSIPLGPPLGTARVLYKVNKWAGELSAADPVLARAARALVTVLERTEPDAGFPHLVHGTLYARHVLDLGDAPGVIDWQRFGQGLLEHDAGVFLASLSRHRLRNEATAREAALAEEAFLAGTGGLLDRRALAWYQAAALLHLARRLLKRQPPPEAHALLVEAAPLAEAAR